MYQNRIGGTAMYVKLAKRAEGGWKVQWEAGDYLTHD